VSKKLVIPITIILALVCFAFLTNKPSDTARINKIANNIKCVECQGLSIAQSSTTTSKGLVEEVKSQVKQDKTDSEIYDYISDKYGEDIVLTPQKGLAKYFLIAITVLISLLAFLFGFSRFKLKNKDDNGSNSTDSVDKKYYFLIAAISIVLVFSAYFINKSGDDSPKKTIKDSSKESKIPSNENKFLQAIKETPNDAVLHFNYADFLISQKEYAKALIELDKTVELDPKRVDAQALSGWLIFLSGLSDQAELRLEKAISIDAEFPDSYFFLAMINRAKKNSEASKSFANQYIELAGESGQFYEVSQEIINTTT
jgi:cytochrome c-type biogenesis protein CcmH